MIKLTMFLRRITFAEVALLIFCAVPPQPTYAQWQKHNIDDDINRAVSVDAADMAGDTKLDLVVTNYRGNQIILYQNNFPEWIKHTIDNAAATFAFSADIDGNDTLDVVACLYAARKMVWYENSHPTWTQHIIDANPDHADFMLVADFNNDDKPDVVTAGDYASGGDVVWYENGYPTWTKHIIEAGSGAYPSMSVSDIDGDGLLDVAATMNKASKVVWFRNENNGLVWTKHTIDDSFTNAWGIDSGDIDGDGATDVVATSGGPYLTGGAVMWYENHHPTWTKHIIDASFIGANAIGVADVDGDDTMDVIATSFTKDAVVWYENNHPTWPQHIIDADLDGPSLFALADVDENNINDLIVPGQRSVVWYQHPGNTVDNEMRTDILPTSHALSQNYPNPFNPTTTISYALPHTTVIALTVADLTGRRVRVLDFGMKPAGSYEVTFDATGLPSGVYFYRLEAGNFVETKSLILSK